MGVREVTGRQSTGWGRTSTGTVREGRRARLAELLSQRSAGAAPVHPLSAGQRALWLLQRLAPASWAYNAVFAARIVSPLDHGALDRALTALVGRHPVLRTAYPEKEGSPVARVDPPGDFAVSWTSGRSWSEARRREWLTAQARRPLDLAAAAPFAVHGLDAGDADKRLLLVSHHIALDGWSLWIVLDELGQLYEAELGGAAVPPAPSRSFAEHVGRQDRDSNGARGEALREFWRRQLDQAPSSIELPYDRPPSPRRPPHAGGASHFLRLDAETTAGLKRLCRAEGTTLYMVLLAAFQALLTRYSGAGDLLVGSPFAGRGAADEDVVGYFVNPLPVRARADDDPPFRQHLARVRDSLFEIHEHQDLPLPLLIDALGIPRVGTRPPLFQVFFAFQKPHRLEGSGIASFLLDEPGHRARLGRLELESLGLPQQEGQFDLTLQTIESRGGIAAQLGYDPTLFEAATVARVAGHFRALVAGALADSGRRLSELPILSEDERRQILSWDAIGDHPRDATLHGLFLERCREAPEAVAVDAEGAGGGFEYRELARWSAAVAGALAEAGVARGDLVAVAAAEGAGFVAALLGVSRAGACFVCIEPQEPPERLGEILRQVAPAAILLPPTAAPDGPLTRCGAAVVRVPEAPPRAPLDARELPRVDPEDAAFVAFTSGSTGLPKGIVQSHASFCQFLRWQSGLGFGSGRRVAQWAAATYDAAYCEIFGALGFGATLCLPDRVTRFDPPALVAWLERNRVELLQVVPSFLRELLAALPAGPAPLPALDTVLAAGEELTGDLVERFFERFGGRARLFNLYGPTETVLATCEEVEGPDAEGRPISIGRAIEGRQVLVLDRHRRLCPIGAVGEIHVRSPHLSRGYFRRPGATAERYLPEPSAQAPSQRAFRTGDLGRWRADGCVDFLGRRDALLKVRGVRVELGEIEIALRRHPEVHDAAVAAPGAAGERRLVAWLVPRSGGRLPSPARLRSFLARRLPLPMVPSAYVEVAELPRTATGKLDRRALPVPSPEALLAATDREAPRSPEEREVASLWSELLGIHAVASGDDFFALGGHSLLAMRMMHALAERTGVQLPVRTVFEASTVEALAERLAAVRRQGSQEDLVRRLAEQVAFLSDEEVTAWLESRGQPPIGEAPAAARHPREVTEESSR